MQNPQKIFKSRHWQELEWRLTYRSELISRKPELPKMWRFAENILGIKYRSIFDNSTVDHSPLNQLQEKAQIKTSKWNCSCSCCSLSSLLPSPPQRGFSEERIANWRVLLLLVQEPSHDRVAQSWVSLWISAIDHQQTADIRPFHRLGTAGAFVASGGDLSAAAEGGRQGQEQGANVDRNVQNAG